MAEFELVASVVRFLCRQGYRIRVEVPSLEHSTDLVATRGRWVTFCEAKIKNWRRALVQCDAHVRVADFICIAIGTRAVSKTLFAQASKRGFGVIHVQPGRFVCRWILLPRMNTRIWPPERRRWARCLRKIDYEH